MLFLVWEKLRSQNFDFPSLKNIRLQVSFWQAPSRTDTIEI